MFHPLQKMRIGFVALSGIVAVAIFGFHWWADYSWIDAVWIVAITISTVGFSEHSDSPDSVKLLSIATILLGVTAAAYTFTGMIQMMLEGEIDRALGKRRMERQINKLVGHTLVCGFGKSGPALCHRLKESGHSFVVVENDEMRVAEANDLGYLTVSGDATDEELLKQLRIEQASTIVVGLPTDAENVFITLSARNLCPNLRIVASAEKESSSLKLRQAGANEVVLTHRMVADHMSRLVTRPSAAHFFDILSEAGNMELEIDELIVAAESPLVNQTIASSRIRDRYSLLVVGLKPEDQDFQFNPAASHTFAPDEIILVMGRMEMIERFKSDNRLSEVNEA